MTAVPHSRVAPFDMGQVLGRSFQFFGARWGTLLLLSVVVGWPPEGPLIWLRLQPVPTVNPILNGEVTAALVLRSLVDLWLRGMVLAMALAWPARRITVREAFGATLRVAPVLAPWWLAELVPSLVLIWLPRASTSSALAAAWIGVAAIYLFAIGLALAIGVYSAVVLAERGGFWRSLRRAASLMGGGRWKFVLLYVLFQLAAGVPQFAASLAGGLGFALIPGHGREWLAISPAVGGALARLIYPMWSAITAMSYRELSRIHGGVAPGDVADLFS